MTSSRTDEQTVAATPRGRGRSATIQQLVMRGLLLFSLSTIMFCYGFAAREYQLFPFDVLRDAQRASTALVEIAKMPSIDGPSSYRVQVEQPTVFKHGPTSADEFMLVSAGGFTRLPDAPNPVMAWIINRQGEVVHTWDSHPDLWRQTAVVKQVPGISGVVCPTGLHLYPDGGLLATYHGQNTFPYTVGLARFDRDSKLLWKKELLTHHFFSVDRQGHIFVPGMEILDAPVRVGNSHVSFNSASGKIYGDQLLELDADGNEVSRHSILKILCDSGFHGLLSPFNQANIEQDDPIHVNDVQVITSEQAKRLPGIEADDLLISLRNLNTVAILDRQTKLIKWSSSGTTVGQHSPRIFQDGVLIFDNLGGDEALGGTRLVQVNLTNHRPTTLFPKPQMPTPDVCRCVNCGHLEVSQDNQHALMAVTHAGCLWEVNLQTGQVVWEYILNDPDSPGARGKIGFADYVSDLSFLDN